MKIIKRNGAEETFDRQKIKNAIEKANNETDGILYLLFHRKDTHDLFCRLLFGF